MRSNSGRSNARRSDARRSGDGVSEPAAWRATVGHLTGRVGFGLLYSAVAHGSRFVPRSGPVILAANHTGYLDGALVLSMAPRPSHFLVMQETFDTGAGPLLRLTGQIPIDQRIGDRTALGQALAVLRRGGVVGIFPEGGRGRGDLAAAGKGVAWLALNGHAPVVPVACLGTRRTGELAASWPRLRSRMVVDFGSPLTLDLPDGLPGRKRLDVAGEQIRSAVADHVHEAAAAHGIPLPTDVPPDILHLD